VSTVGDIIRSFETWAPTATAESWDNVGLQLGDPQNGVKRALVALDLTPTVAAEAIEIGVDLVITHHPVIFRPIRSVRADDLVGSLLLRLARANIALYSAHTNLDSARGGVSFALAEQLGLRDLAFLAPDDGKSVKLVTFVPEGHVETVYRALCEVGAGAIGGYTECAFLTHGTGRFRVPEDGDPMTGSPGSRETTDEVRLEMEVQRSRLATAVAALRSSHPYEEVAFDVMGLENQSMQSGMGVVGNLEAPLSLADFLQHVAERLLSPGIRYSGNEDKPVFRVAACGGSGSGLTGRALAVGADAFVTGDISYHRHFEPLMPDGTAALALVDAGHYETERPAEEAIIRRMSAEHSDVAFARTRSRTTPVRHFATRP
jgi:dinuclear metal center YbgI/SA1388 family protein